MSVDLSVATGYLHESYAAALQEFGSPRLLPRSGGWILERSIPGTSARDAMGCYPIFCCRNWDRLAEDLRDLEGELTSVVLVSDPFCPLDRAALERCFDVVVPFKEHFLADLRKPTAEIVSKSRRRFARNALRRMAVSVCERPESSLEEWLRLYSCLANRHDLSRIHAFSRAAFERLFGVPGLVAVRAVYNSETVGMHLMLVSGDVVYGHLGAYSEIGYQVDASYALHAWEIEYFRGKVEWIDWGGVPGVANDTQHSLGRFKKGFSSDARVVFLCGRILNAAAYQALEQRAGHSSKNYFPSYRLGEFE